MIEGIAPLPLTVANAGTLARLFGGIVHGNDLTGAIDVEFASLASALSFRDVTAKTEGWRATLRTGDVITDLDAPVVLTVRSA